MTSLSVRWVLVEGTTGEGDTLDRGSLPTDTDQPFDADALLSPLFDKVATHRVHAVGLTWTGAAEATASAVWQALTDREVENVIAVSDLEAAESLTCGIAADIDGYDRVVVCVVEPDAVVIAAVTPDGVTADRVDAEALGDVDGVSPDAVFVVGSGDVAGAVAALERSTQAPVISADDADLALARGSAVASASAVSLLDAQIAPAPRQGSPTATLASVLAVAVLTFVVSLSVALGMTLVPDNEAPRIARSEASVPEAASATPAAPAKAAPRAPKSAAPRAPETPARAEPVAVAVPVPDAALIIEPPDAPVALPPEDRDPFAGPAFVAPAPAYIPPAPAYVPPALPPNYLPPAATPAYVPPVLSPAAAPAYVPPVLSPAQAPTAASQQQPRLRDRIIERIPLINRLHEPDPYGQ